MSTGPGDSRNVWPELVTSALVGTERQAPRLPPPGTPLGDALAGLEGRDAELQLLASAGATALYRRVGRLPLTASQEPPAPAEAESGLPCSALSARHLEWMLSGRFRDALPEWLAALQARGRRVPERLLPELPQAGRQDRTLREPILEVAGARGRWLAAQNPEWSYLALGDGEEGLDETWETSGSAARQIALHRLRAVDPARARALVEQTWAQEAADVRLAFLNVLRVGLSPADEPFLDAALNDRSKGVRQAAADLLARLPGSQLVARMTERAARMLAVRFSSGFLGLRRKLQLEVTLPDACDALMVRDGVEQKVPAAERRYGEKAWWLVQVLAAVPPSAWSGTAGVRPQELVDLALTTEWKGALLHAWCLAAGRHHDGEWAEALLLQPDMAAEVREALVIALAPARREALVLALLDREPALLNLQHPAFPVLMLCRHAWSETLARAVVRRWRQAIFTAPATGPDWALSQAAPRFGLYLPLSLVAEVSAQLQGADATPALTAFAALIGMLEFRRDMIQEIHAPGSSERGRTSVFRRDMIQEIHR